MLIAASGSASLRSRRYGMPNKSGMDWPDILPGKFQVYKFRLEDIFSGDTYRLTMRGGSTGLQDRIGNTMKDVLAESKACIRTNVTSYPPHR